MKKNVWLLGAAVAALTSCTQSEVLDVPEGKKIQFESFVEKPTRAVSDLLPSTFTKAWIFGYCVPNTNPTGTPNFTSFNDDPTVVESVFAETPLTKNDDTWGVDDEKHWKTNYSYRFAGYSNGNSKLENGIVSYNPETDVLNISSYNVVDYDDGGTPKDLVAAIAGDRHSSTGATPVNFQFRHLLSKITFYITNASGNADLHLTDIKLNNVHKTAKCVCTYQNSVTESYPKNVGWTSIGDAQEFNIEDIIVSHAAGSTTHQEITYYVIPQLNASATLTLLLQEKMGGDVHYSKIETFSLNTGVTNVRTDYSVTNAWVPGYHYKYTLTRGTTFNQIEFNVNIDTWNEDRDGNGSYEDGDNVSLQGS